MITQEFQTNRACFPLAELAQHRGTWVAFSPDGRRILASGATPEQLEDRMAALGIDACQVVLESVPGPEDDIQLARERNECSVFRNIPLTALLPLPRHPTSGGCS